MVSVLSNLYKLLETWHQQYVLWCYKKKIMNKKASPNKMYIPTDSEHWANTMSHAIMIIPSILGSEILLSKAEILKSKPNNISRYVLQKS